MTEHFPPPILNYSTLASLHTPATTNCRFHLPHPLACPLFNCHRHRHYLHAPPSTNRPFTKHYHSTTLLRQTNSEADCGPGFCSSHKNTAKFKMRSSHKNTANYDQDSSHKNTVPHRPCISCRHSLSPSSPSSLVNGYHYHSLPLSKLPLTQHLPSHTVSSPTVSFMPLPSPITIIITSTSTHQLLSSVAPPVCPSIVNLYHHLLALSLLLVLLLANRHH